MRIGTMRVGMSFGSRSREHPFFCRLFLPEEDVDELGKLYSIFSTAENNVSDPTAITSLQRNLRLGKGNVFDSLSGTDVQDIDDIFVRHILSEIDDHWKGSRTI